MFGDLWLHLMPMVEGVVANRKHWAETKCLADLVPPLLDKSDGPDWEKVARHSREKYRTPM